MKWLFWFFNWSIHINNVIKIFLNVTFITCGIKGSPWSEQSRSTSTWSTMVRSFELPPKSFSYTVQGPDHVQVFWKHKCFGIISQPIRALVSNWLMFPKHLHMIIDPAPNIIVLTLIYADFDISESYVKTGTWQGGTSPHPSAFWPPPPLRKEKFGEIFEIP